MLDLFRRINIFSRCTSEVKFLQGSEILQVD